MPETAWPVAEDPDAVAKRAAVRVNFQLTYGRSPVPRVLDWHGITGPDLDDAYQPDQKSSGDWENGGTPPALAGRDEQDWIKYWFNAALNEAVHEALEWFRVDDEVWLDPHGDDELEVFEAVNDLVDRLVAIRERRAKGPA